MIRFLATLSQRGAWIFLIGFLVLGGVVMVGLPAFQAPDEQLHWTTAVWRATALAGDRAPRFCSTSVELPFHVQFDRVRWQPGEHMYLGLAPRLRDIPRRCTEQRVPYGLVTTYPSVLIGYSIFGTNGDGVSAALYYFFSRLISGVLVALLFWRVIAAYAARGPTPGLASISVLLWSPLLVQQSFAITADTVMNLYALSMVAVCLRAPNLSWPDLGAYAVLGITAAWTKPTVAPLVLVPLVWVWASLLREWPERRRTWRGFWHSLREDRAALPLLVLTVALLVSAFLAIPRPSGYYAPEGPAPERHPAAQAVFVKQHLWQVLGTFWTSVKTFFTVRDLTGVLGWLDTPLPTPIIDRWRRLAYGALFFDGLFTVLLLAQETGRRFFRRLGGWLCLGGAILVGAVASLLATAYAMYVSWTPVGAAQVEGVQARYFFPTLIVASLALAATRVSPGLPMIQPSDRLSRAAIVVVLASLILSLAVMAGYLHLTLWARYW